MKIGLFGGSFNPPHNGHIQVSRIALRKLQLDQLWWIVTPGNPLKDHNNLLVLEKRLSRCREIAAHPAIRITAFEATFNIRFTADTLEKLTRRRASVNFIWVMGADNLASFHHWNRWRKIASMVPIAVIDRPDCRMSPHSSPAAHTMARFRMDESDASLLADTNPPAWTFIHGPRSFLSSTQIRNGK